MPSGLRYPSGEPLLEVLDEDDFGQRIESALLSNAKDLVTAHEDTRRVRAFRELQPAPTIDPADVRAVGWTYLVHESDPNRQAYTDILEPLARHRGMKSPRSPLVLSGVRKGWAKWMIEHYQALDVDERPGYVLLVGGPEHIPFEFQTLFNVAAHVGRVSFDSLEELGAYVEKLLRLENPASEPSTHPEVLFFAPDKGRLVDGSYDVTHFSRIHMADPLAAMVRGKEPYRAFGVIELMGPDATKEQLSTTLRAKRPAFLFTASHGMAAAGESLDIQMRINGAIACQRTGRERAIEDFLFAAADVPRDEVFLEGAIVLQFACFGYGTPARSAFAPWHLGVPDVNASADFIAALPKALLAHPRGPIAFIGHVDTAWLHGFDDPDDPAATDLWHPRLGPFRRAVDSILTLRPSGLAMIEMYVRLNQLTLELTSVLEAIQRGEYENTADDRRTLAGDFIGKCDAQNYMLFGDPAARVRVAS